MTSMLRQWRCINWDVAIEYHNLSIILVAIIQPLTSLQADGQLCKELLWDLVLCTDHNSYNYLVHVEVRTVLLDSCCWSPYLPSCVHSSPASFYCNSSIPPLHLATWVMGARRRHKCSNYPRVPTSSKKYYTAAFLAFLQSMAWLFRSSSMLVVAWIAFCHCCYDNNKFLTFPLFCLYIWRWSSIQVWLRAALHPKRYWDEPIVVLLYFQISCTCCTTTTRTTTKVILLAAAHDADCCR